MTWFSTSKCNTHAFTTGCVHFSVCVFQRTVYVFIKWSRFLLICVSISSVNDRTGDTGFSLSIWNRSQYLISNDRNKINIWFCLYLLQVLSLRADSVDWWDYHKCSKQTSTVFTVATDTHNIITMIIVASQRSTAVTVHSKRMWIYW